ncbi:MAG: rhodanese-like domain-containing protein [Rhodospirillales bacterium]|nr:rhodanese-like domain-containing protein [Rhodospirillales bacterium]
MNDLGYAGDKTPEESWAMLSEISGAVLVDVRTDAEWAFVGTPDLGSLGKNLCLAAWIVYPNMTGNADFVATVENHAPDTDAHILFICRSGQRSIAAAIAMTNAGYSNCYNVLEGFEGDMDAQDHRGTIGGWKVAGLPWAQR